jgi:hypothetical protein
MIFIIMTQEQKNIIKGIVREYVIQYAKEGKKPTGGLAGWFRDRWVDISRKKKGGGHPECGASAGSKARKGGKRAYPKCVPASKAASMSSKQKKSAVTRKRKKGATGRGKAKMVSTYTKD